MTGMEIVGPSVQRISTTLPSFLFALGILVVGYVIAKIAAGLVSRALGRTNLDARTAEALGLTKPGAPRHGAVGGGADHLLAHHALRVDRLLQSDRAHAGGRTAQGRRGHDRPSRAKRAPRQPHLRGGLDPRRIAPVAGREDPHPTRRRAAIRPLLRSRGDGPSRARADDGKPDLLPRAPPGGPPLPRRPGTERPRGPALRDAAHPALLPPQCGGGGRQHRTGLGGCADPSTGGPQSSGRGRPRPGGGARWPRRRPPVGCARQPWWRRSSTSWSGSHSSSRVSTRSRSRRSRGPPSTPSIPSSPGCRKDSGVPCS